VTATYYTTVRDICCTWHFESWFYFLLQVTGVMSFNERFLYTVVISILVTTVDIKPETFRILG
jgi:hypothetical protein